MASQTIAIGKVDGTVGSTMTYRDTLYDAAAEKYGYICTKDATRLGVPTVELRKLASRGKLQRKGLGLYRFPNTRPNERDTLAEAVFTVGEGAFLTHDAVLLLHGLALVNPNKVRVATPNRVRRTLPDFVEVLDDKVPDQEKEVFEGIPTTRVARAITDCVGIVMRDRLQDALKQAISRGLVTRQEAILVRKTLRLKHKK